MRVPVLPGIEVRVELNEAQVPIAATIVHGASSLQVLAFAAPRNSGIWADVRSEIAESVRAEGGHVDEVDAGFGPELRTRVRGEAQHGKATEQVLRFVGFDGPRWFVRGVFSGPAATHPAQATVLETVLTSIVVVRGTDPMAPRDPLPLRLPKEALAAADPAAAAPAAGRSCSAPGPSSNSPSAGARSPRQADGRYPQAMHEIEPDAATEAAEATGAADHGPGVAAGHGVLRRALHRLTTPEHILEAESRQEQSLESGGTPVERCRDRAQVCVVGMLRTVTIQPRGGSPSLQAELWDGSGSVDVVWIGRRRIPGIEPGRVMQGGRPHDAARRPQGDVQPEVRVATVRVLSHSPTPHADPTSSRRVKEFRGLFATGHPEIPALDQELQCGT